MASKKQAPNSQTDYLIAKALCTAAGSGETELHDADAMLDLLIERYPTLAQKFLREFKTVKPAAHLRVA